MDWTEYWTNPQTDKQQIILRPKTSRLGGPNKANKIIITNSELQHNLKRYEVFQFDRNIEIGNFLTWSGKPFNAVLAIFLSQFLNKLLLYRYCFQPPTLVDLAYLLWWYLNRFVF